MPTKKINRVAPKPPQTYSLVKRPKIPEKPKGLSRKISRSIRTPPERKPTVSKRKTTIKTPSRTPPRIKRATRKAPSRPSSSKRQTRQTRQIRNNNSSNSDNLTELQKELIKRGII